MPKLTLSAVKPTIARVLGKSTSSSEVVDYINEAQERLLNRGDWRGSVVRYRVCVTDAKLTWPRWVEAIRKVNVCSTPTPIASKWYEFVGVGPGTLTDEDSPGLILEDMQEAPTFNDIGGLNRRLYVISNQAEDADTYICIQGYDENGEWIRTTHDGELVDGEYIEVDTTGHYSDTVFANVTAVIKPATNGVVTLSEFYTVDATFTPIGRYEPDEERPSYRRSRIPGLADVGHCGDEVCDDGYTQVQVMAKLRHIPVANDNDWLIIGNLPALKDMVQSIVKAEKNLPQEAEYYESRAIRELEKELTNHHLGESVPTHDNNGVDVFGGAVEGVV